MNINKVSLEFKHGWPWPTFRGHQVQKKGQNTSLTLYFDKYSSQNIPIWLVNDY